MKILLLLTLSFCVMLVASGSCNGAEIFQVDKINNKELKKAEFYYSISPNGKEEALYFSSLSIALCKGKRIIIGPEKDIPIIVYGLCTARYEAYPELAAFTNFASGKYIFDSIKKINCFPKGKIIAGYGICSLTEPDFKKKDNYFIITIQKTKLNVLCFKSKEEFEKKAKEFVKTKQIELQDVKIFFKKAQKSAISCND